MSAPESDTKQDSHSLGGITIAPPPVKRTWTTGSYSKLSHLMGSFPEIAIFRRFGALNIQNLLFLQAELSHLEYELQLLQEEYARSDNEDYQQSLRCWWDLKRNEDTEQLRIIMDIREKLSEYNAFLLQYQGLCKLHPPSKQDFNSLREWLIRPKCGNNFLRGIESMIWDEEEAHSKLDMITMLPTHTDHDMFSHWVVHNATQWFHRVLGRNIMKPWDEESGIYHYNNSISRLIAHLFGVAVAAMIPVASIFTLYYVRSMVTRLIILLCFSLVFSLSLAIFTTAKKAEIFAATAAFASVQVVFVGSTST